MTAALWLTVAILVGAASLLPVVLFPLLGVMPAKDVAPIYLRDLVMLFPGAFVVALGLGAGGGCIGGSRSSSSRRSAPRAAGSCSRFMAASAFLSMWINNTATTLLMLPIVGAVLARADEEDGAGGA